jgi:AbiV family abortive infection protein
MSTLKNSSKNPSKGVDYLIQGTAYAIEQSWHLLQDAVLLIQNKRYQSSLVSATYCLEQLGRAQIYREKAKRVVAGERVTLNSMKRDLQDHIAKLYRAQIPVTAAVTSVGQGPDRGSEEGRLLGEQLAALRKMLEKQAPHKALHDRQRAIHVDPVQGWRGWNRPCQTIVEDDADYYVGAATVRYGLVRSDLKRDDSEVGQKIWEWILRLDLPEAPWDVWTWEEDTKNGSLTR